MLTLLTLTFNFQTELLFGIKQQKPYRIPYRSTQYKTVRVQKQPTFTWTATTSSHTQHYDVIWCVNEKHISNCLVTFYHYQWCYNLEIYDIYNVNPPCSPLDVETCRGALFNQCIFSCVLMALVYIHNTVTWIQMWKQCVVFLQQTATSKYTPSWCSFTIGADNYHIGTKNSNEMPNCCTMYIFHQCAYLKQQQAFAYLHTATIVIFRSVKLIHAAGCLGKLH